MERNLIASSSIMLVVAIFISSFSSLKTKRFVLGKEKKDREQIQLACDTPMVSVFAIQNTCINGAVFPNSAYIQLSAASNVDRYAYSTGNTFIGSTDYALATAIGAFPDTLANNLPNPTITQAYTVRFFNGASDCFRDVTIHLKEQDCSLSCNCTEYIYLNETTTGGAVHKFAIEANGNLQEINAPWYDNTLAGEEVVVPHGLGADLNGYLYIGETNAADNEIRRFTCDGEIIPESEFGITTGGQFNFGSIGNTLYVGERNYNGIVAYDLCTGLEVSRLGFCEGNGNAGNWGFYIDPNTKVMYATVSQVPWRPNRVYIFSEADFTNDGAPCVSAIDTFRNDINFPTGNGRMLGVTTDTAENIYLVVYSDETESGNPTYLLKYGPGPGFDFIAKSPIDTLNDGMGFREAHGIVYSETANRLYISTNSPVDDCVSVFDTDLNYLDVGVPAPGDSSRAKGIAILKECCPTNNNLTIDTILCNATINEQLYLQDFVSCNGVICEGVWETGLDNIGMTYNACNHSIVIDSLVACGTFTLESDGVGNSLQCGAFKVTVHIEVGRVVAPTIAGNQVICSGGDPAVFTIATSASSLTAVSYQWQSSLDAISGYTNITGATDSVYNPPSGLIDTTYFRVLTTVGGDCTTGRCSDTSNVIQIATVACDWGDLPEISTVSNVSNYQTIADSSGPAHIILDGLNLGTSIDAETDGQPSDDAQGDGADEDGMTIYPSLNVHPGSTIRLPLDYQNSTGENAYIKAWIDWNGDGNFLEANEMIFDESDIGETLYNFIEFTVPYNVRTNHLIGLRIRISQQANMTPYGLISEGEVEDYLIGVQCPTPTCLPVNTEITQMGK